MNLELDERGFTLIELSVVVLIIAVLIVLSVPTFLGARQRASERSAQSSIRTALVTAKTLYTDHQDFGDGSAGNMSVANPNIDFVQAPQVSTKPQMVSVTSVGPDVWVGVAKSSTGRCFAIRESVVDGTTFASTLTGACEASAAWALSATDTNW